MASGGEGVGRALVCLHEGLQEGAQISGKIESMTMKLRWIVMGIAIFVAFLVFFPEKPTPLPDELFGVWTTPHPKYVDRYVDFTKATIIFGTGKGSADTNFISNVERTLQDNTILYTVYFHRAGGPEDKVSFYYDSENGGLMRFKNQKHIEWKKETASAGPPFPF